LGKLILVNPDLCTGCRLCELACSLQHYKEIAPSRSRINVIKWDAKAIDIPVLCLQCYNPVCATACPTNAIYRNDRQEVVVIDKDKCIECKSCMYACPIGGITVDPVEGEVIKCDLCGGDPQCVAFCPTGALEFVEAGKMALRKRRIAATKMSEVIDVLMGGR